MTEHVWTGGHMTEHVWTGGSVFELLLDFLSLGRALALLANATTVATALKFVTSVFRMS